LAKPEKSLLQAKLRPFLQKTGFAIGPTSQPYKKIFRFFLLSHLPAGI
jgi:hypothetical protein